MAVKSMKGKNEEKCASCFILVPCSVSRSCLLVVLYLFCAVSWLNFLVMYCCVCDIM